MGGGPKGRTVSFASQSKISERRTVVLGMTASESTGIHTMSMKRKNAIYYAMQVKAQPRVSSPNHGSYRGNTFVGEVRFED